MTEFAEIIDSIENLPFDSKEILVDIINKRFSETQRVRFIESTIDSHSEYLEGNYIEGNSNDLFKSLKI